MVKGELSALLSKQKKKDS